MSLNPVTRSFLLNALETLKADLAKYEAEVKRWIDDRTGGLNKTLADAAKEKIFAIETDLLANQEIPEPVAAPETPAAPAPASEPAPAPETPAAPASEPAPAPVETPAA